MFSVIVDSTELDLSEGTAMELVMSNPFFVTKLDKQDYSYPFSITATPKMRRLFGHVQDRSTRLLKKEYDCVILFGEMSREGTLRITEFDDEEYRAYVYVSAFQLSTVDTPLSELSRPLSGNLATQWQDGINQSWPDTPLYFPTIYNLEYYETPAPEYTGIVNGYSSGYLWNTIENDGKAYNKYAACPMPAVLEVIRVGVEAAGYTLRGSVLEQMRYRRLFFFTNRGLDDVNDDPGLHTVGTRTSSYNYDLDTPPTKLSFQHSSGNLFSNDQYTYTFRGLLRVRLTMRYEALNGDPIMGMRVRLLLNGSFYDYLSGSIFDSSGEFTWSKTINVQPGDFGDTLHFDLQDVDGDAMIEISSLKAEFEVVDGENRIIRFHNPQDLSDYLPAVKFRDLFNGFLNLFQLVAIPDRQRNDLYIEERAMTRTLNKKRDFDTYPKQSQGLEISPVIKAQMVRYQKPGGNENEYIGKGLDPVWVYEDRVWRKYETEPNEYAGDKLELKMAPILGTKVIPDYPFHPDFKTLRIDHLGSPAIDEDGVSIEGLFIGYFEGVNSDGVCPADFKRNDMDLRMDKDLNISVLQAHMAHIEFRDQRSRKRTVSFFNVANVPGPYDQIIYMRQLWLWEKIRLIYSRDKPVELEMELF